MYQWWYNWMKYWWTSIFDSRFKIGYLSKILSNWERHDNKKESGKQWQFDFPISCIHSDSEEKKYGIIFICIQHESLYLYIHMYVYMYVNIVTVFKKWIEFLIPDDFQKILEYTYIYMLIRIYWLIHNLIHTIIIFSLYLSFSVFFFSLSINLLMVFGKC